MFVDKCGLEIFDLFTQVFEAVLARERKSSDWSSRYNCTRIRSFQLLLSGKSNISPRERLLECYLTYRQDYYVEAKALHTCSYLHCIGNLFYFVNFTSIEFDFLACSCMTLANRTSKFCLLIIYSCEFSFWKNFQKRQKKVGFTTQLNSQSGNRTVSS